MNKGPHNKDMRAGNFDSLIIYVLPLLRVQALRPR